MARTPIHEIDIDEARRLYESGLSFTRISAKMGGDPQTIGRRLKAAGVAIRPAGRRHLDLDIDRIVALKRSGVRNRKIAEEFGVSVPTIRHRLLAVGVIQRRRPPQHRIKIDIDEACRLYQSGMSIMNVALEMDLDVTLVRRRLVETGIERRHYSYSRKTNSGDFREIRRAA